MSDKTSFDPRIAVRPRSLDQTIDLALAYVRICARDFVPLFSILTVVSLAIVALALLATGTANVADDDTWHTIGVLLIGPITERAVTVYGGRHLFSQPVTVSSAAAGAMRHLPLAAVSTLVVHVPWILMILGTVGEGFTALPAAGLVIGTFWPFILASHLYLREVTVLEHMSLGKAMRRARILVQYRFERALGLLVIGLVVRIGVSALAYSSIRFVLEFVLQFTSVPGGIISWATAAGWVMAGQFLAVVRLFDYVDARTRREGWDIQIRFDAIKQRDEAAQARRLAA